MPNIIKHGKNKNFNSLKSTFIPHFEKNFSIPIGDTTISLNGKKNLELLNGMKNPTPLPPEVIASNNP